MQSAPSMRQLQKFLEINLKKIKIARKTIIDILEMAEPGIVYNLTLRINRLQEKTDKLVNQNVNNNLEVNRMIVARIQKFRARITKLKWIRNDQVIRAYSQLRIRPKTAPVAVRVTLKIEDMQKEPGRTSFKITPSWFKGDDKKAALKNVVYPAEDIDHDLVDIAARYRFAIGKSQNFRREPLEINQKSTETLVLALNDFAQQYGGELSFTNDDLSFAKSTEQEACGVANLGSVHLLATDSIPTAKFSVKVNLNYDKDLARSDEVLKTFALDFTVAVAKTLHCKTDYVRVFSIEKAPRKSGVTRVNFGLTTPDQKKTESLAHDLQDKARLGFPNDKVLRLIKSDYYKYELTPALTYLQLKPQDFDTRYDFDYTQPGLSEEERRGKYPYYLPIGWYRHALNMKDKYPENDTWLGRQNVDGEWPVAFHGTKSTAVGGITQQGLSPSRAKRDLLMHDAIEKAGVAAHGPGLYVATHCNGGADRYTEPFHVSGGDRSEKFRVVFQCRVRPDSFTSHTSGVVTEGEAWRVVDPKAVRPYGLLLKKEIAPS